MADPPSAVNPTSGQDALFGCGTRGDLIDATSHRRARRGAVFSTDERVPATRAAEMSLSHHQRPGGPARRIEVGAPADLCLLDTPVAAALVTLPDNPVPAAVIGGILCEPAQRARRRDTEARPTLP